MSRLVLFFCTCLFSLLQWKMMSELNMSHAIYVSHISMWFCFTFILWVYFSHKTLRNFDFESHWNTLTFLIKKKCAPSDFHVSHGKMSDFVSFSLFGLTLVIKLRNFDFESCWNILTFLVKKKNAASDFHISHGKMSDFVSFSLFGFTLVIKLRNFDFESHWNTLIIFGKKMYSVTFEYVPWKNVWFCFISIILVHFSHKTENSSFLKSLKWFKVFWKKKKNDVRIEYVLSNSVWFRLSFVVWVEFWRIYFKKKHFNIFQFRNLLSDQNLSRFFLSYLNFLVLL